MIKILVSRIGSDGHVDPLLDKEREWLMENSIGSVEEDEEGWLNVYASFADDKKATEYCLMFEQRDPDTGVRPSVPTLTDKVYKNSEEW